MDDLIWLEYFFLRSGAGRLVGDRLVSCAANDSAINNHNCLWLASMVPLLDFTFTSGWSSTNCRSSLTSSSVKCLALALLFLLSSDICETERGMLIMSSKVGHGVSRGCCK